MTVKFTKDHEWVRVEGSTAVVGISDYAQQQLGDVVYVELPEVGRKLERGKEAAVVESVKAASEVYAPLTGEVTAANSDLTAEPARVNSEPLKGGWFFKMTITDPKQLDGLMSEAQYADYVTGLG
ncbi:MAG TPA: glycine cleavage system protein GcvH [Stellaceae bacterium]|nr:glycine cleavage system protein GcvH [Stellaceae bacterium]